MNAHADKAQEKKSKSVANDVSQKHGGESTFQFADNRPEAVAQRKLQEMANNSSQVKQAAQLQAMVDNRSTQQQPLIQKKENKTGLPDNLKTGIESLSGYSMDDVKVHYNSDKPAQLQAHAYAQGTDIHIASGQEKHLPHEAWHVVQQKQGRVTPTMQMKEKVNINDDAGLEQEADVMGAKAANLGGSIQLMKDAGGITALFGNVTQLKLSSAVLNVAGETHNDYDDNDLRAKEKAFAEQKAGGTYWTESEFKVTEDSWWNGKKKGESGDPVRLQLLQVIELVDSLCGKFIGMLDHTVKDGAKLLRERMADAIGLINGGIKNRNNELIKEHNSDVRPLSDTQIEAAKNVWAKCIQMNTKCVAIYKLIQEDGTLNEGSDALVGLKDEATKINDEIKVFATALNDGKAVTQEKVRVPRSQAMHFSAQASFATKGIWKVGNNHYTDIANYVEGTFVKAPKYNLMSKADFITERDKFNPDEKN